MIAGLGIAKDIEAKTIMDGRERRGLAGK